MIFQFTLFGPGGLDPTQITSTEVYGLILRVTQIALGLIGAIAIIYIIVAGIQYITAAGAANKQVEAKRTITYAIIGVIVAIASFAITNELLRRLQFRDTIEQRVNERVRQANPNQPNIIR